MGFLDKAKNIANKALTNAVTTATNVVNTAIDNANTARENTNLINNSKLWGKVYYGKYEDDFVSTTSDGNIIFYDSLDNPNLKKHNIKEDIESVKLYSFSATVKSTGCDANGKITLSFDSTHIHFIIKFKSNQECYFSIRSCEDEIEEAKNFVNYMSQYCLISNDDVTQNFAKLSKDEIVSRIRDDLLYNSLRYGQSRELNCIEVLLNYQKLIDESIAITPGPTPKITNILLTRWKQGSEKDRSQIILELRAMYSYNPGILDMDLSLFERLVGFLVDKNECLADMGSKNLEYLSNLEFAPTKIMYDNFYTLISLRYKEQIDMTNKLLGNVSLYYRNFHDFSYTLKLINTVCNPKKLSKYFKDLSVVNIDDIFMDDGKTIKPVGWGNLSTDTLYGLAESWAGINGENQVSKDLDEYDFSNDNEGTDDCDSSDYNAILFE